MASEVARQPSVIRAVKNCRNGFVLSPSDMERCTRQSSLFKSLRDSQPPMPKVPIPVNLHNEGRCRAIAYFLLTYYLLLVPFKVVYYGPVGLYEMAWLCNSALLFAAVGILKRRMEFVETAIMMIPVVHGTWVVDIVFFLVVGYFPFGSAAYVVEQQTSIIEVIMTSHHAWFIPLCFVTLIGNGSIELDSYINGLVYAHYHAGFGRYFAPRSVNLNMSHFWPPEVKLDYLHWADDMHAVFFFLFYLFNYGVLMNGFAFVFLRLFSILFLHPTLVKGTWGYRRLFRGREVNWYWFVSSKIVIFIIHAIFEGRVGVEG